MAQVTVTVNGRPYQIGCEDGEEEHLKELAQFVDGHMKNLVQEVGQVGEARLLLMTAMLVADELAHVFEERDALQTEVDRAAGRIGAIAQKLKIA